jgi:hypothetical protein
VKKTSKLLKKLNPKEAMIKQAIGKMRELNASEMFKMFNTQILPFLSMADNIIIKAEKIQLENKVWYAIMFRDKEDEDKNR